ncbi:hypothetical protein Pta02_40040 [Planobispora takensis]|uniref:Uncharacterized protein n=1 Tax=Planobispora takensis TaxID=1367882 RepID=A0A8J3T047_9ACTN|nr:hypothetical protein Pta02_40040 [Planobispora takensis]
MRRLRASPTPYPPRAPRPERADADGGGGVRGLTRTAYDPSGRRTAPQEGRRELGMDDHRDRRCDLNHSSENLLSNKFLRTVDALVAPASSPPPASCEEDP